MINSCPVISGGMTARAVSYTHLDVLLQIQSGTVCFSIGMGTQMESISLAWDDDEKIKALVRELNFGRYQNTENGGYTHD